MVDVFFVYLRAIEPVTVLLRVGAMFAMEHIMLPCAMHGLRKTIGIKPDEKSNQVLENTNVHVTSSSSNLHAGTGGLVALQTARGILRGERKGKVRVLFDRGSHCSFVTLRAPGLANPKSLRREFLESICSVKNVLMPNKGKWLN